MDKKNLRAVFEKSGRAVYISHLDLLRTMQRALTRSGIPVWFTQGFNPRIYINFPLALSLGVKSSVELMDFAVTGDIDFSEIKDMLNPVMPDGLRIIKINEPVCENKDIGFSEYTIDFYSDKPELLNENLGKMLAEETVEVQKRSKKKGIVTIDIKPYINILDSYSDDEFLRIVIRLPAGQEISINSNLFIDTFAGYSNINLNKICVERTKILDINGNDFV